MLGKRDGRKVLAIMLVLLTVVTANMFAAIGDGTDALGLILQNVVKYVFGYALGGIMLVKFGIDLVSAVMKKDQDPASVTKAVIGFVTTLVVVLAWQPILNAIIGTNKTGAVASTGDNFVKGLLQTGTTTGTTVVQ